MFSYIKRHWPVYVILTLIAIALGFGAAYIVGAKGSTPASAISEEVEQEQSTGADGIPESEQAIVDGGSSSAVDTAIYMIESGRARGLSRPLFHRASASLGST